MTVMHMSDAVIFASQLTKSYGGMSVVDYVSFLIPRGELCGILGPNGAGKTTTPNMLVGNVPPTAGRLRVLGFSIPARARQMRLRIGVVPQEDNLDPDFTVIENLKVYGQHFGLKRAEINARIPFLLSLAALEDKTHYRINQLWGDEAAPIHCSGADQSAGTSNS
ncbi:ATP-binding cassette domain-containing protein [Methylocaldum sp. RMAD-M]|jgi:lipooligosaccharide transport system ATP-binding protein|uniref:ATP-binding cassette domain-containing protein n=1 Tax=Methylocaldum sp. RMAD-M TaxID=2806557 RepID=UPI001B530E66|nr:ATP-binding cassette domain-containing protein [Methylocaldum sp. RMAD-M]MBP1151864.1 ABC-type multidrug transport system ATPase subunit [Methylocaldum sp. RMAD-M]